VERPALYPYCPRGNSSCSRPGGMAGRDANWRPTGLSIVVSVRCAAQGGCSRRDAPAAFIQSRSAADPTLVILDEPRTALTQPAWWTFGPDAELVGADGLSSSPPLLTSRAAVAIACVLRAALWPRRDSELLEVGTVAIGSTRRGAIRRQCRGVGIADRARRDQGPLASPDSLAERAINRFWPSMTPPCRARSPNGIAGSVFSMTDELMLRLFLRCSASPRWMSDIVCGSRHALSPSSGAVSATCRLQIFGDVR